MRVDIWSDIVCPWCYIGKRRFEQALQALGQRDQVEVVHHSFELDPSMDRGQTVQLMDMLAAKYRLNPAQASEAESRVAATAAADGLGYTSDRPVGNTFDAHRLIWLAEKEGVQDAVVMKIDPNCTNLIWSSFFGGCWNTCRPSSPILAPLAAAWPTASNASSMS